MQRLLETQPSSVCVLRLSAIGDTCHTVPVVRALQDAWPDTRITWIIGRTEHALLEGLEGVEFLILDKKAGLAGFKALRAQLRGRRFPVLLHMHASLRANTASLLVSAERRLGFDLARARDYQWLFANCRIPAVPEQHVMDGLLEFARTLGVATGQPRWDVPLPEPARAFASSVIGAGSPTLVISPCSGQRLRNYRNWDPQRYAIVADHAHRHYGARVILTGGRTALEAEYAAAIARHSTCRPVDLIGKTDLKELLAVLEQATVLLCPDSGPAHMATAVGTPVVGLYATSNPQRTGPYRSLHLVANRYPDAVRSEFNCEPEALRFGERVRNPEAMNLISTEDVIEKLAMAFAERGVAPTRQD